MQLQFNLTTESTQQIEPGYCHCGCGQLAPIAKQTRIKKGHIKDQPCRFIIGHANKLRTARALGQRFWEKVDKRGPDDCWPWIAGASPLGYGYFMMGSKKDGSKHCALATRVGWELVFGPIPRGMGVLHQCDNPPCCNPAHWFLGTQGDNMRDMVAKGRGGGQFQKHIT